MSGTARARQGIRALMPRREPLRLPWSASRWVNGSNVEPSGITYGRRAAFCRRPDGVDLILRDDEEPHGCALATPLGKPQVLAGHCIAQAF